MSKERIYSSAYCYPCQYLDLDLLKSIVNLAPQHTQLGMFYYVGRKDSMPEEGIVCYYQGEKKDAGVGFYDCTISFSRTHGQLSFFANAEKSWKGFTEIYSKIASCFSPQRVYLLYNLVAENLPQNTPLLSSQELALIKQTMNDCLALSAPEAHGLITRKVWEVPVEFGAVVRITHLKDNFYLLETSLQFALISYNELVAFREWRPYLEIDIDREVCLLSEKQELFTAALAWANDLPSEQNTLVAFYQKQLAEAQYAIQLLAGIKAGGHLSKVEEDFLSASENKILQRIYRKYGPNGIMVQPCDTPTTFTPTTKKY